MPAKPDIPQPPPSARRTCVDCGAEFEAKTALGPVSNCCDACHARRMDFKHTSNPEVIADFEETAVPRPWHRSPKLWIFAGLALAGLAAGYFWRKPILAQYRSWSQERHAGRAARSFEAGDYERAIIDGRQALELNPFDVETNRVVARAYEAMSKPDAVPWRERLNKISPGDKENTIAWATAALKHGDLDTAKDALLAVKPADRETAGYHDSAGEVALAMNDTGKAEQHWARAVQLDPDNDQRRLKLASVQVKSRAPGVREAAMAELERIAESPVRRRAALKELVVDAMNHREFKRALELVDKILLCKDSQFIDRIGRLAVLRGSDSPDAPAYLEQLRDESLGDAKQLTTLLDWMNENQLPLLVSDWVPKLPAKLVAEPPVALAVADAYGKGREWTKLKAHAEQGNWKDYEHIRRAHVARALEEFGREVAAKAEWERALAETGNKAVRLASLARLAQLWHWDERAEIALRKLSADESTPLWVLDALWQIVRKTSNSEELHHLSRLIVRARPKNPEARNNFIWLCLLRHSDEATIHQLASELHNEYPEDITISTTRALSLFQQGKVFDAVKLLESFPEERLRAPAVALYYSVFLHALGNAEKAAEYAKLTEGVTLLREEDELLWTVRRDSRFNTLVPTTKSAPARAEK